MFGNFETRLVQLSGQIYAIDQQMVRSFVIVGKQAALCIDAGVVPADFAGMISSVTRFPVACCLTHTDGDHTANLHAFSRVYIHPSERPLLTPDRYSDGTEIVRVSERDCFDLGGIQLKVVACPGHTPGSIALLDEKHGILFSILFRMGRYICLVNTAIWMIILKACINCRGWRQKANLIPSIPATIPVLCLRRSLPT